MRNVRQTVNSFKRRYTNVLTRPYIGDDDFNRVVELARLWEGAGGTKHKRLLDTYYFKSVVRNHKALGLENLLVEVEKELVAMTCFGLLPTGQAWSFTVKFNGEYRGISDYLMIVEARRIHELNPTAELINIGIDFGNKGLAMAKEKFRPVQSCERWALFSAGLG